MIGAWLELPVWAMVAALVAFYGGAGGILYWLSFRSPARDWVASFRGLVAAFFSVASVIFALLYGFVANDVWRRETEAVRLVRGEADSLLALRDITAAAGNDAATLRALIVSYAKSVTTDEWPRMTVGESAPSVDAALAKLMGEILSGDTARDIDAAVRRALVDTVLKLRIIRADRLAIAADRTDEFKWATLLILGLLTEISIAAVHLERPRPQIAALVLFSTSAVIALGLIAIEERPFDPPASVSPAPLQDVIRQIPAE